MCKKWVSLALLVLVLSLAWTGGAKAVDPNLVGWWPLNEGAGDVVADLSVSNTTGRVYNLAGGLGADGSVWLADAVRGAVIGFNGTATGAFVRAGTIPQMTLTNDFTWSFWAKQDAGNITTNDIIVGNRMDENTVDFVPRQFIKFTPTKFEWHMNGNGDDNLEYEDIPADVWLYHAVVKDGDRLTYYRNGAEASARTFTQPLSFPLPLFFGGDNEGAEGENWQGSLSDVRTYNKAAAKLELLADMLGIGPIDVEIVFAIEPPVIDGQVDTVWAAASTPSFVPQDANSASGNWKALYDSENLYVMVDVADDSLQNDSDASWQDDSVEVYFDGGNSKLTTALSGDDHQYTFGWTADDIQGTNIAGYTEGIEQGQVTTDTGWRIEIKMPWTSLLGDPNAMPEALGLIGVDCFYNDDDGGDSRESAICTFADNADGNAWNDASRWGTAILGAVPVPVDPNMNGLVARYAFENDVNDNSGNGLNGVLVGNATFVEGLAAYGMAMQFDGESYVDCGNDSKLDVTGPISLSLWIRPDAEDPEGKGTETAPLAKASNTMDPSWSWQVRYGWNSPKPCMAFTFNTSPRAWVYVNRNLVQGEWAHIACTHDGGKLKCYLDGVETDSTPMGTITSSSTPLLIGSDGWGDDWIGAIDEVAVYNRALSVGEVLYLAGYRADTGE